MSVNADIVRKIGHLARIKLKEENLAGLADELNVILGFVEQLDEVDVSDVEPMTSVIPATLRTRKDEVTSGGYADKITSNAPLSEDNFFMVPKVVE
ncbi:MAG: Asp-tRNA(Asn)/Glu-tRNA(Gln) amidotransferase subunit GatC [Devosiaceae bacterium]|nr:Asp-tRNA(Asn)/Glu-tRNA(Gln) amidotransferase subunit GatC [Devosiaceae bacterium]